KAIAAAETALKGFQPVYDAVLHAGFRRKLGLLTGEEADLPLISGLLEAMAQGAADFTLTFRNLADDFPGRPGDGLTRAGFADPAAFDMWEKLWRDRLSREPGRDEERRAVMRAANPRYIPRNHRVEALIAAAVERQD